MYRFAKLHQSMVAHGPAKYKANYSAQFGNFRNEYCDRFFKLIRHNTFEWVELRFKLDALDTIVQLDRLEESKVK